MLSVNDLVLVGTGFVLARILYVWYMTPARVRKSGSDGEPDDSTF